MNLVLTGTDHYAGWGEFEGAVAEDGGGGGAASSASLLVRCVCKNTYNDTLQSDIICITLTQY